VVLSEISKSRCQWEEIARLYWEWAHPLSRIFEAQGQALVCALNLAMHNGALFSKLRPVPRAEAAYQDAKLSHCPRIYQDLRPAWFWKPAPADVIMAPITN